MPTYTYEALNKSGQHVTGTLVSNDDQEAKRSLQAQGLFLTKLATSEGPGQAAESGVKLFDISFGRRKVKMEKIVDFLRQLATLVEAKLPLVRALTALIEQEEDKAFRPILESIRERVQGGSTLADAMAQYPQCFSRLAVNMIRAGESGGVLESTLNRLADFTEQEQDLRSTVRSAMIYPIVLASVMGLAITLLMTFAVPRFTAIFKSMKIQLPAPTRMLIAFSNFLKSYWWVVIIAIMALVSLFNYWRKTPAAQKLIDRLKFRLPLFGTLTQKLSIARFSRTFGTLVDGGIPILHALNIAKDTAGNYVVETAIDRVSVNVKEGERIAKPLRLSGVFPPVVIHMISVGEESGRLGPMLYRIAETYDKQTRVVIKTMMTVLEPLIIVVLAGVVTLVILAMLLPMLETNALVNM